jgi:endonuclease YncB( thermonuclease family)
MRKLSDNQVTGLFPFSKALFYAVSALGLLLTLNPALSCVADRIDARETVVWVYDGDTIKLERGERVRVIGINAPELGREVKPAQPYAKKAHAALRKVLSRSGNMVSLRYGKEKRDKHGRLLAHLYLQDGSNVAAELLRRGLAVSITIPPNEWNLNCYRNAESHARKQNLGLWRLSAYRTQDSRRLQDFERGYRIVKGIVERVGKSRYSSWLNLQGGLAIRIDHADGHRFTFIDFSSLEGKRVVVRGWIYKRSGRLRLQIRHPADLQVLS